MSWCCLEDGDGALGFVVRGPAFGGLEGAGGGDDAIGDADLSSDVPVDSTVDCWVKALVQVSSQLPLAPARPMAAMTSSSATDVVAVVPDEQLAVGVLHGLEAVLSSGDTVSIPEYSNMWRVWCLSRDTETVTPVPSAAPAIL